MVVWHHYHLMFCQRLGFYSTFHTNLEINVDLNPRGYVCLGKITSIWNRLSFSISHGISARPRSRCLQGGPTGFTLEICRTKNRMRSIKQHIKYFVYRYKFSLTTQYLLNILFSISSSEVECVNSTIWPPPPPLSPSPAALSYHATSSASFAVINYAHVFTPEL